MDSGDCLKRMEMAFRDLYNCEAEHVQSLSVVEHFQGKKIWEGKVQMFSLTGHAKTARGYAWVYEMYGEKKITAVLELPPVTSPLTAVQQAIIADFKVPKFVTCYRFHATPLPTSKEVATILRYEGYFYCLADHPDHKHLLSELLLRSSAKIRLMRLDEKGDRDSLLGYASTRAQVDEHGYSLKIGKIVNR